MREIKIALIEADVALPVIKDFIAHVREKAVGEQIVKSVSPAQMVVKIVHDTLVDLLGESAPLALKPQQQNVVLMVGLQGSGKTTSAAKLARRLQKDGKKVLLASLDTYRPAAQEQLAELGRANQLTVLPIIPNQKPLDITRRALAEAKATLADVLILDTAGRLHIDDDILTRIDGDSRGGAALSMRAVTGVPVQFLGTGEKTDALEVFDAKRIAGRILGMGDVVGLVETAMEKVNQEEAQKTALRMMNGQFDLNDLLSQMRQMNKMGDIKGIMKMIPGLSKFSAQIDAANINNNIIKRQEAIILSMTPYERRHPEVLKASRKQRIAGGAGVSVNDVNRLLKQYDQMAEVMKKFKKMGPLGMLSLMKKMGGTAGGNPFMNGGGFPPF